MALFRPQQGRGAGVVLLPCFLLAASNLIAQQDRIAAPIDASHTVVLRGSRNPKAQPQYDLGAVEPSLELAYVTLLLRPSTAQQADLERLLDDLQTPSSPGYHKWLTPEQYAGRFGLSHGDVAKVVAWLESAGLKVNDVARGRHWITFTGTARRVGSALRTEIHRYRVDGAIRHANVTEPSVPEDLADVVAGIQGLDDFPERSGAISMPADLPAFTSGATHYMAPDDFATIYHVNALYQAGIDGTGQKIAIVGRTDISVADIRAFRSRYNLPPNDPQVVLVGPDPGTNATDQGEAYLDLEWSGAVARNATIIYVNSTNVRTSAQYAVDQDLAKVISFSYYSCEQQTTPAFRSIAQQAAAQGITWMACTGDAGANSCDPHDSSSVVQSTKGRGAAFPASIPEVTAVGGTMFNDGGGTYWGSNGANLNSVLSYIPETAWNETDGTIDGLFSGGGGPSIFFAKPAWQTGPGVPNDNARDVPDVSLSAAIHDGYLTAFGGNNFVNGGTSASTPSFAGIVALLNQYLVAHGSLAQAGLGNVNPALYRLAQNTTDVFHDITTGDNLNPCAQESPNCVNGLSGYAAGPNYDLATGLGSVDAYNLVTEWSAKTGSATTTKLTTNFSTADLNGILRLTATVSTAGSGAPGGTASFTVGNNDSSLGSATLSGGTASLTVPANLLPVGSDTLWAVYSGDATFNGSAGSATVAVTVPPAGSVVVASATPNPVYQGPVNAQGFSWIVSFSLKELAGVSTTLTGFTIAGQSRALSDFFSTTTIPSKGTISTTVGVSGLSIPTTAVFGFTGADADGRTWTQQVSVTFQGPGVVTPAMLLTAPQGTVQQNPNADPLCQWSQPVYLQEEDGYTVQLTRFTAGTKDLSSQIQQIFGATRLAPFGTLAGTVCWSGIAPPQTSTYSMTGVPDNSATATVTASLSTSFGAAAAVPPSIPSVTPSVVTMSVPDSSQTVTTSVALAFDSGAPQWTLTVVPAGRTTSWLQVSPTTGSGSATLNLKASGTGLSNGVYNATLAIQAAGAVPQYLNVTVVLVVGAASGMSIDQVSNVFSFQQGFAPGMLLFVKGGKLSDATQAAAALPLPLSMGTASATVNGVSAPLDYVSPGQLNIQIPYETGAGTAVLGVNNNGKVASYTFPVVAAAPGLWPFFQTPAGAVTATAKQGDILVTYMTGEGDVTPGLTDGATPPASTATKNLPQPRLPFSVTVGGVPATVLFAGIPSGLAGVTQIDFTVPPNAPVGAQVPVVVTVGSASSTPVNLTVTQQ
jgi:uncharacterized protein (TIGR03437 family)